MRVCIRKFMQGGREVMSACMGEVLGCAGSLLRGGKSIWAAVGAVREGRLSGVWTRGGERGFPGFRSTWWSGLPLWPARMVSGFGTVVLSFPGASESLWT